MTATASQIAELRRMTAEPTEATYNDATLTEYIERFPCVDALGHYPFIVEDDALETNPDWTATYDLHMAAAAIWEEKAAGSAHRHDFAADGGNYTRSQIYEQAMKQVRWHLARRNPRTIMLTPAVNPQDDYIVNEL